MTEQVEVADKIGSLTSAIGELVSRIDSSQRGESGADRKASAEAGITDLSKELTAYKAELKAENEAALKAALAGLRAPSAMGAIGTGPVDAPTGSSRIIPFSNVPVHPSLKASIRDYDQPGALLAGILGVRGIFAEPGDFSGIAAGKAALEELGAYWGDVPQTSKATLGATGATGGYVLPNNLVDTLVKPNVQEAVYQTLVTVRTGVAVRGVDQPFRTSGPTRMVFQDWGATKENLDEAYGSYTATLGTMARVYDIGKQYARFSAGSAEQDVLDELGKAAILGENFYMLAGAGTGSVGTGDPTLGVYTSLNQQFGNYTTAFSGASNSTVAGSAAAGLIKAFGAMAARSTRPTAVVMDAITYWQIWSQGSDSAGFWMSELLGAGFQPGQDGSLRWRGVPLLYDSNFNTNTSTTKAAIAADWSKFRLYRGMEFRVDTSDTAGTRFDKNLIGFRGEEEIGFNAATAVLTGNAQLITALIP